PIFESHRPALRQYPSRQHFKQTGLAGPVGTYDAKHLPHVNMEIDVAQNLAAAEIERHPGAGKQRGGGALQHRSATFQFVARSTPPWSRRELRFRDLIRPDDFVVDVLNLSVQLSNAILEFS